MNKYIISSFICCFLAQTVWAYELTGAEQSERMALVVAVNRSYGSLAMRDIIMQKMLAEANVAAYRLKLHAHHPIQMADLSGCFIGMPWANVLPTNTDLITIGLPDTIYGFHIFDPSIPRESRLRALKIGIGGKIDTANYEFSFCKGRLFSIMRMSDPNTEYYANDLDKLVGQPSLIDTNGAYQLATQWLAAVDVDMARLGKLKWTVNQLQYRPLGATNYVTLPLYYVDFGSRHHPAFSNIPARDDPLISVEVLGTTKDLQEFRINDVAFCKRPLLSITNGLDLVQTANPKMKQLEHPAEP
jgi:hypothetical protein